MTNESEWSGDMLDDPEMMKAFSAQLRKILEGQADYVSRIRRDAEAMWKANPPEGYGSFEAWWRHRWVKSPFGRIQEHLEEAAQLTHQLEARYRKGRHELPALRQAARQVKQAPPLGGRSRPAVQPRPGSAPPLPSADQSSEGSRRGFMDMVRDERWSA
ncbi:hypothetical protein [Actinocorallia populi]|uniref:hypothetical protein n=1 Tax=Actinocorallia populi TaxID=2079200 RepID=UPI000D08B80D|nr:hypothetical protein [Actinocorallia populi]